MDPAGSGSVNEAPDVEIRSYQEHDLDDVLSALDEAFGGFHDRAWFDWKHRSGPWGPSLGWVARDHLGLLGVRIFLRWEFAASDRTFRALRPCDTVTVPRARGRGIFAAMTKAAMNEVGDSVDFYFNTPNSLSRPGYLKMGYVEWTRVRQRVGWVRRIGATSGSTTLPDAMVDARVSTRLSEDYMVWRYDTCPLNTYDRFGLSAADSPNGIVTRVRENKGRRLLVVAELWGSEEERKSLVRTAADRAGTSLVWLSEAHVDAIGPSLRRTETIVTRHGVTADEVPEPRLSLGEVEDVL